MEEKGLRCKVFGGRQNLGEKFVEMSLKFHYGDRSFSFRLIFLHLLSFHNGQGKFQKLQPQHESLRGFRLNFKLPAESAAFWIAFSIDFGDESSESLNILVMEKLKKQSGNFFLQVEILKACWPPNLLSVQVHHQ